MTNRATPYPQPFRGNRRRPRGISPGMDMDTDTGLRDRRGPAAVVVAVVLLGALLAGVSIAYAVVSGSRTGGTRTAAQPAAATGEPTSAPATPSDATTPQATTPAPTTRSPSPAPSRPSRPAPAGTAGGLPIPADAMLSAEDLGVSAPVRVTGRAGVAELPQTEPNACTRRTAFPTDRDRVAARTAGYSTPSVPESGGVQETIVRYRPGRAAETLAGMRRVMAACDGWRDPAAGWTHRYRVEGRRFAGDDALLVRAADVRDGSTREWGPHIAIVRVGDVVITVRTEEGEGVSTADRAILLARRAVDRFLAS